MDKYDLIVIGAGPGGYVAAIRAAQKGLKTAVVEKLHTGGCCLNRGCVPTKSLMHAAHLYREIKHAENFGLKVDSVSYDIDEIYNNKNNTVETLRGGIEQLFKANKIDLYKGVATITGKNTVSVKSEEELTLNTDKILIATGGKPSPLPGELQNIQGVYTSDDILGEKPKMFKHVVIIGAGVIALEFASLYSDLGCEVTICARGIVLRKMDKEIAQNLSMILKKRGVKMQTNAPLVNIEKTDDGLKCTFNQKDKELVIECDGVIAAMGRSAYLGDLFQGFDEVKRDGEAVIVNEFFQTSVDNIYAIGDCVKGSTQLAHMASAEGMNAVSHMVGEDMLVDLKAVPSCIYTDPEIATVGITADEAKQAGIAVETGKYVMNGNAKTMLSKIDRSFIKVVFDANTHVILGAQLMCARATDMVGELSTAITNKLTIEQLTKVIRPHPTFVEGVTEAIEDVEGMAIHIMPKAKKK